MDYRLRRRQFLRTVAAAAGATASRSGLDLARGAAKYTRYNATSAGGKKALASYAKGITAMLKLPATHPQNWFRNAFIHLMDCPHGNWWFYVWHRGYLGYFEETIRNLSGDPNFAMPYWDWSTLPQLPDEIFTGVLSPGDKAWEPYTKDLATFTSFTKPAMTSYFNSLSPAQRTQLNARGYKTFDDMWNDVTGNGVPGNMAFAQTSKSRFPTRANPKLDPDVAYDCSPFVVYSGLWPTKFYDPNVSLSFASSKTPSHNSPAGSFSVLEGLPHNQTHNFIGGVPPWNPGPYGFMTNFLSPCDPIFFLHHSNLDRLWDVWTRKQISWGKPILPPQPDLGTLSNEPLLFFVDGKGGFVTNGKAGDYLSVDRFQYAYEPGFGEDAIKPASHTLITSLKAPAQGKVAANTASITVPDAALKAHMAETRGASLLLTVTIQRPAGPGRAFNVLVGAPADATNIAPGSPYYAGTVSFFGRAMDMPGMPSETTFSVPMPRSQAAFHTLAAGAGSSVSVRLVPAGGAGGQAPVLRSATVRAL
jgi:tyrosinase